MFPLKTILKKLLVFTTVYAVLVALFTWKPVGDLAAGYFSKGAVVFIGSLLPKGYFHIERDRSPEVANLNIIRILCGNKERVSEQIEAARKKGDKNAALELQEFRIKTSEFFWMPLIFFFSLLAITPITWKRKLVIAVWGIVLISLFVWIKLLCYTLYHYVKFPCGVYELQGWGAAFVSFVYDYVKMGANMLVATLIWLATSFRRSDWQIVLGKLG
jgi:hypothetical protein